MPSIISMAFFVVLWNGMGLGIIPAPGSRLAMVFPPDHSAVSLRVSGPGPIPYT